MAQLVSTLECYAGVLGGCNPIHTHIYFATTVREMDRAHYRISSMSRWACTIAAIMGQVCRSISITAMVTAGQCDHSGPAGLEPVVVRQCDRITHFEFFKNAQYFRNYN